ncbi:unnamed protein product [Dracunculus medinensis]|uniref:Ovule protein n=1 Tax=Dracunculus medinensis TaxID=318479 RepID=A0A0N4ULG6_DRAME|nr:unnamed protein product [Dracunculus medinensis]
MLRARQKNVSTFSGFDFRYFRKKHANNSGSDEDAHLRTLGETANEDSQSRKDERGHGDLYKIFCQRRTDETQSDNKANRKEYSEQQ